MQFWDNGILLNLLWLTVLLGIAGSLRRLPGLGELPVPTAIVAGFLGLFAGPSFLGWLPIDVDALEILVYHGLALVFIAVSLQEPETGESTGEARSFAFAIATMNVLQAMLGLGFVLLWTASFRELHPGFGLMLPLGFQQGPGQALSLGSAWEATGMTHGGAIGLIVAATGFVHCVLLGVPLVMWGRRRALTSPSTYAVLAPGEERATASTSAGGLEPLSKQLAAVGCVYAVTFAVLLMITPLVPPADAAMLWGFHFILGALLAMAARRLLHLVPGESPLDKDLLGRVAAITVDLTTCAAISAVRVDVLLEWAVPILVMTTIGGLFTLVSCLWLAPRVFPRAPFEHAVVLFGSSTGTVPTGLALLKLVDPDLKSPAPRTTVLGSAMALVLAAPLLLIVIKMPIEGWPESFPSAVWKTLAVLVAYQLAVLIGWRILAPFSLAGPLRLWPQTAAQNPSDTP